MFALDCVLTRRPTAQVWDVVSGLIYQFHSVGLEEGEEPAPEGESALVAANEFELAIEPGVLLPPEKFSAYFENRRDAEHAERAITTHLAGLAPRFTIREVEEKNYAELWKQNFQPIRVKPFWLIRASWHEEKPQKDELELVIEPGMAFGTGSHETTKACLELMTEACMARKLVPGSEAARQARVLDFGCGSGILAIGLKKLGIGTVYGVDIDPLALEATQQNAAANDVSVATGTDAQSLKPFDGIVANILKNTLLDFSEPFWTWLKPSGFLVLSGLLGEQEDTILERYRKLGFKLKTRVIRDNWVSLLLDRP